LLEFDNARPACLRAQANQPGRHRRSAGEAAYAAVGPGDEGAHVGKILEQQRAHVPATSRRGPSRARRQLSLRREEDGVTLSRDPKYTFGVARAAIEQIAALELPADPPSFAVWYHYVSAQNPVINDRINELLHGNAKLSLADVDRICDEHLSPTSALARIERVEEDLAREVDSIMESIVTAGVGAAQYRADLAEAHSKLDGRSQRDAIRSVVLSLVQSTREMDLRNAPLETALKVSRQVIEGLQKDVVDSRRAGARSARRCAVAIESRYDYVGSIQPWRTMSCTTLVP